MELQEREKRTIVVLADKQEVPIEVSDGVTVLVNNQNMKIEVPESVLVSPRTTVRTMEDMNEEQWQHISTGELFQSLWKRMFEDRDVPETLEELLDMDTAFIHVSGMIIMCCEAMFSGKTRVHLDKPETYLPPTQERLIMSMMYDLQKYCGTIIEIEKEEEEKRHLDAVADWLTDNGDALPVQ